MNTLSLFDGISCGRLALDRANIQYDHYYASEIDPYAIKVAQKNYPDTMQLGDITRIDYDKLPPINLVMGGSPCQGFSFAGAQLNFDDPRSQLFFDFVWAIEQTQPEFFLLENVKMAREHQDIISGYLGVEPIEINSDRFVPQNRARLYWTNLPIPQIPERHEWDNQYYSYRRTYMRENKSGVAPTLMANMGTGGHNVPLLKDILESGDVDRETSFCIDANYYKGGNPKSYYDKSRRQLVWEGERYRKLTPVECERLQTLPDNWTEGVSDTQRYKMIGNAWTVDVVAWIFSTPKMNKWREMSKNTNYVVHKRDGCCMIGLGRGAKYGKCIGVLDPHHITNVGAGGEDTPENTITLCRRHHNDAQERRISREECYAILDQFYKYGIPETGRRQAPGKQTREQVGSI
jgi:site-specific DNA-cytosine methylase